MKPRALTAGDTIALVSPASPLDASKVSSCVALLEENGYCVHVMPHAFDHDEYLAGSDVDRASDLQVAFADPSVSAVLCTRGGYGCARLIPHLDLDAIAASGKMLLGFSDITTLHAALNRRGLVTFHAPMAFTLGFERENWVFDSFLATLRGADSIHANAPRGRTLVGGSATGRVVGGCLCLITDSLGTADEVEFRDNLILIEDVDEAPHRIDAMLTHLLNSGRAEQAAGFIVGEMTRTDDKIDEGIGGRPWIEILMERLGPLGKPMIVNFPFGHSKQMLSLPLGIRARLEADLGSVTYLESACA